jgi:hypothetical protein
MVSHLFGVCRLYLQVYVNPIPPVLDVTRKMVIRYNALYKEAVKGIKGERCCCLL